MINEKVRGWIWMKSGVQDRRWRVETEKVWGIHLNDLFEALLQGGLHLRRLPPKEQS